MEISFLRAAARSTEKDILITLPSVACLAGCESSPEFALLISTGTDSPCTRYLQRHVGHDETRRFTATEHHFRVHAQQHEDHALEAQILARAIAQI